MIGFQCRQILSFRTVIISAPIFVVAAAPSEAGIAFKTKILNILNGLIGMSGLQQLARRRG
jgi:hypothetical protein